MTDPNLALFPDADDGNAGWVLVSTKSAHMWSILSSSDDTQFMSCPSSKGQAVVTFPIDITSVPTGAVITSVTVSLRYSLGSGTAASNHNPSVTVFISSNDRGDYSLNRTLYPTSATPTTSQIGSFKKDAAGLPWDIERLNRMMVGVFSYEETYDLVRVYELYVTVNYRNAPNIAAIGPSGTLQTSAPTLQWKYSQAQGDVQKSVEYRIFTAAQQAVTGFDPRHSATVYDNTVTGTASSEILPTSLDPGNYWVYYQATSSYGAQSLWEGKAFQLQGPSPGIPGVPDPEAEEPGSGIIETIVDSGVGAATLTLADTSNMLSVQDADAETLTDGSSLVCSNCGDVNGNAVRDPSNAFPGGLASWVMEANAAGPMTMITDWVEVAGFQPITAQFQVLAQSVASETTIQLQYYDVTFTPINEPFWPTFETPDSLSTWSQMMVTDTTPSNAFYARMQITINAASAGEAHNIDRLGIMYGTNTPWSDGGHMSRNLLSCWYSSLQGTPQGAEAWNPTTGTIASTTGTTGTGVGFSGTSCGQMAYVGVTPSIGIRGEGAAWTSPTPGTDFTLNAPTSLTQGDLMIAYVRSTGGPDSINPPAGWDLVDSAVQSGICLFVLMRSATATEPTSWTDGSLDEQANLRSAIVIAYSGAADASEQFIDEATNSTMSQTPTNLSTPQLNNTDPNAWRVSGFAYIDDAAESNVPGSMTANQMATGVIPAPQYVGSSWLWATTNWNANQFYIFKPANIRSGDYMLAFFSFTGSVTVTPPSGWTVVTTWRSAQSSGDVTMVVMQRWATSSEPAQWGPGSWTGSYSSAPTVGVYALAYRNVNATTPLQGWGAKASVPGQSLVTGTVNNANSLGYAVAAFAVQNGGSSQTFTGAGSMTNRVNGNHLDPGDENGIALAVYDRGPLAMGNQVYTGNFGGDFFAGVGWLGLLNPLSSPPGAVANETQRSATGIGGGTSYLYGSTFDSNGTVLTGTQSVTGNFIPGDGDGRYQGAAGWAGIVAPAEQVTAGVAQVEMATQVDISQVSSTVMDLADGDISVSASFTGTSGGTPYMLLNFYRANQLIDSVTMPGSSFVPGVWQKSAATCDMPSGTTRVDLALFVPGRNVGDLTYFDRVSIGLGSNLSFRTGTSRAEHPIWTTPVLEYAEDDGSGYGPYAPIPGSQQALPPSYDEYSGLAQYTDHSLVPLRVRKYRAKTISYGISGDQFVSPYGPESNEFQYTAQYWWLKDFEDPTNNLPIRVKYDTLTVGTTNTGIVYQPIGSQYPVVLTEGFKSDTITLDIIPVNHADWVSLMALLRTTKTLYLQSDVDQTWWVQPMGDVQQDWLPTFARLTNPLREIKVTFLQVENPE